MAFTMDPEQATKLGASCLPGHLGVTITEVAHGLIEADLPVRPELMAPNGYLHAASVVGLADTACGFGAIASLPEGASGFTTIELKSNFLGTARGGVIRVRAEMVHGGRTTQLWDATVTHAETGKTVALFRCTQMVLWPKADG